MQEETCQCAGLDLGQQRGRCGANEGKRINERGKWKQGHKLRRTFSGFSSTLDGKRVSMFIPGTEPAVFLQIFSLVLASRLNSLIHQSRQVELRIKYQPKIIRPPNIRAKDANLSPSRHSLK